MKRLTACIGLTALILTACGGPTAPKYTLSVNVPASLKIDEPTPLNVTVKNAQGDVVTGKTVTWTSSDTSMVMVNAAGQATARHLSASRKKVTLTATLESGETASADVNTYGLDTSIGVYHFVDDNGVEQLALSGTNGRFQGPNGEALPANASCTYTAPAGGKTPPVCVVYATIPTSSGFGYWPGNVPVSGNYSMTLTVNGVTYTKTVRVDPQFALPLVKNPLVSLSGANLVASGTDAGGIQMVSASIWRDSTTRFTTDYLAATSVNVNAPYKPAGSVPSGEYVTWITTANTTPPNQRDVLPDNVYWTNTDAPKITVP